MANINVRSGFRIYDAVINNIEKAAQDALAKTAEALHTEVVQAQVVPRDTGALQNEKFFVDDEEKDSGSTSLVFEGPYARRLYYHPEYNFQTQENSFAQGKWLTPWLPGGISEDFVQDTFTAIFKREAGL